MVKILKANAASLRSCVDALSGGKVIVYPTDTIYGLGVDATNRNAVRRLFRIKKRDPKKPVYVAVASLSQAGKIAELNETALTLADEFLPGPLTLILKSKVSMPQITFKGTIGIRIPDHAFVLDLLRKFRKPITATSANLAGANSAADFRELDKELLDKVDIVVDGGKTKYGKSSTMVDLTNGVPKIVREGFISEKAIADSLNTNS